MGLGDYSARFLGVLVAAYPEFQERVTAGPDEGCFSIEFVAPSGSVFCVNTLEEERITVGFDAYHCHFGGWAESIDAEDFNNAILYIRKLMSGEYQVAVWTRDGEYCGSVVVERGKVPENTWENTEGLTLVVKSWSL